MGAGVANLASDKIDLKQNQSEEIEEDTTYSLKEKSTKKILQF